MTDFVPKDDTGFPITIDARVRLTDVAGPPLGGLTSGRSQRYLLDMEGVVVGIDELNQFGIPKGDRSVWLRLDGDTAIVSIYPSRMRVIKAAKA